MNLKARVANEVPTTGVRVELMGSIAPMDFKTHSNRFYGFLVHDKNFKCDLCGK